MWDRLSKATMEAAATNVLKRALAWLLKGNNVQTLNLDLCHAGGEREEEPNVLHHKAKRYLGTHPHGSKV